jgi:hypothetical protein
MSEVMIETAVCHGCYTELADDDNFCRHCGNPTGNLADLSEGDTPTASYVARPDFSRLAQPARLSESPWVVLPVLFLILGPLGLPLLWRSRRFTTGWKIALTVVMVCMTAFLVWSVWYSLHQAMASLQQLDKLGGF